MGLDGYDSCVFCWSSRSFHFMGFFRYGVVVQFGLCVCGCSVVSRSRSFEERSHFKSHCWAQRTDLPVL